MAIKTLNNSINNYIDNVQTNKQTIDNKTRNLELVKTLGRAIQANNNTGNNDLNQANNESVNSNINAFSTTTQQNNNQPTSSTVNVTTTSSNLDNQNSQPQATSTSTSNDTQQSNQSDFDKINDITNWINDIANETGNEEFGASFKDTVDSIVNNIEDAKTNAIQTGLRQILTFQDQKDYINFVGGDMDVNSQRKLDNMINNSVADIIKTTGQNKAQLAGAVSNYGELVGDVLQSSSFTTAFGTYLEDNLNWKRKNKKTWQKWNSLTQDIGEYGNTLDFLYDDQDFKNNYLFNEDWEEDITPKKFRKDNWTWWDTIIGGLGSTLENTARTTLGGIQLLLGVPLALINGGKTFMKGWDNFSGGLSDQLILIFGSRKLDDVPFDFNYTSFDDYNNDFQIKSSNELDLNSNDSINNTINYDNFQNYSNSRKNDINLSINNFETETNNLSTFFNAINNLSDFSQNSATTLMTQQTNNQIDTIADEYAYKIAKDTAYKIDEPTFKENLFQQEVSRQIKETKSMEILANMNIFNNPSISNNTIFNNNQQAIDTTYSTINNNYPKQINQSKEARFSRLFDNPQQEYQRIMNQKILNSPNDLIIV